MLEVSGGGGKETSKKKREYQWRTSKKISEFEFEFVWFNAWLYNGTDELWAGFMKELYTAVENHYRRECTYTYALKKAQLFVTVFLKYQHNRRRRRDVLLPGERSPIEC